MDWIILSKKNMYQPIRFYYILCVSVNWALMVAQKQKVSGFILWDNTFPNLISWHWWQVFNSKLWRPKYWSKSNSAPKCKKMHKWNSVLLWFQRCRVDQCCLQPPWCPVKQIAMRLGHIKREGVSLLQLNCVKSCWHLQFSAGTKQLTLGPGIPSSPFGPGGPGEPFWGESRRKEDMRGRWMDFKTLWGEIRSVFNSISVFSCSTG